MTLDVSTKLVQPNGAGRQGRGKRLAQTAAPHMTSVPQAVMHGVSLPAGESVTLTYLTPPVAPTWIPTPIRRKISLRTPAGTRNNVTVTFQHSTDPRQVLMDRIGAIPDGLVQLSRILVAVYQPPIVEKTDGGIILTQKLQTEDLEEFLWQGKVGLIVGMGSQAYVDDDATKFHGVRNSVGDWVWFRPSNGMACEVNGVFCRVLSEGDILGAVPHPDYVW